MVFIRLIYCLVFEGLFLGSCFCSACHSYFSSYAVFDLFFFFFHLWYLPHWWWNNSKIQLAHSVQYVPDYIPAHQYVPDYIPAHLFLCFCFSSPPLVSSTLVVEQIQRSLMQQLYCVKYTHSVLFRFFCIIPLLVEIQRKNFTLFCFFFCFY